MCKDLKFNKVWDGQNWIELVDDILILEKYEKESSKLKMLDGRPLKDGAWTINLENTNIDTIHTIIYKTNKYIYQISRGDALKNGVLRIFGGERKLVVPLEFWRKVKC